MTELLSLNKTLTEWAEFTLKIWGQRMSDMNIANAQKHLAMFKYFIISAAGGDSIKIDFMFQYIMKFTDMGVGKGVKFQVRNTSNTTRKQKMWFSKTFLLEVKKLANIMAANFAHSGTLYVKETLAKES